jgi:P4 family phage/plasmid primase-like protien
MNVNSRDQGAETVRRGGPLSEPKSIPVDLENLDALSDEELEAWMWSDTDFSAEYAERQEYSLRPLATETEAEPAPVAAQAEKVAKPKRTVAASSGLDVLSADSYTEGGMGAAFHEAHGAELIAVREWKSWAQYQPASGLWQNVASEEVTAKLLDWFAAEPFPALRDELRRRAAEVQGDAEETKKEEELSRKLMAKAARFREMTPCGNAARYAFGKSKVASSIFDAEPDVLLTADGAVELRTGQLRSARPEDHFTRMARAGYERGYTDPLWNDILSALPEGVADYLQIIIGNSLTGHTLNQSMVFFFSGDGSNGKSTLTDVFKKMLGSYADRVDSSILLNPGEGNLFGKAKLKALRAAFIEELPKSNWLDALIIKELAETAEMTAAKKFQDEETFDFTSTVFVNTNYLPQVSENDRGTWRRLAPIPMPYTYVSADEYARAADPEGMGLRKKSTALAKAAANPSILKAALAWAVEGAVKWYAAGSVEPPLPEAMERAKRIWRGGQDKIELWWNERIVTDPTSFCLIADLHDTFELEMSEIGRPAEKARKFMEMLQAHPLFKESGAEYVQRQRAPLKTHIHSSFTPDKRSNSQWELEPVARLPKNTCFYVKGIRFRTEADDTAEEAVETPDTAAELLLPEDDLENLSESEDDQAEIFGD